MFKMLSRGYRSARATGGTRRVQGLTAMRGNGSAPHPGRPAFVPETPQQQGFDGKNGRLSGLEE